MTIEETIQLIIANAIKESDKITAITETFKEAGIKSISKGLQIYIADGRTFEVTIKEKQRWTK